MDVDDASAIAARHLGGHEAEEAGQDDEVDGVAGEEREHPRRARLAIHRRDRDPVCAPALQRTGVGAVARHERDVGGAIGAERGEVLDDGLEVRPAPRGEHGDLLAHVAGL